MSKARIMHELHDDFGVTLSEAEKAYDIAVEYIRLRSAVGDHPEDYEPSEYVLVKALSQPDVAEDTISRQTAINALRDEFKRTPTTAIRTMDVIRRLSPAQPERMRGHWIEVNDSNRISGRCSVCGWESHLYEDDVVGMDFCPNCGADMRGEL